MFLNLILNSTALKNVYDSKDIAKDTQSPFASLTPQYLYPRLLSDIKFDKLSEADKTALTFLDVSKQNFYNKKELWQTEIPMFAQEAHNNTCRALGIKPTQIIPCMFRDNAAMNADKWVIYDAANSNIFLNMGKDYTIARPSLMLESVNAATMQHKIYQDILRATTDPESLSDYEYFVALSCAVKTYVYEQLRVNDPQAYRIEIAADYATPDIITQVMYGFNKTRQDFQGVNLYGGAVREGLRHNEEVYYDFLSRELLTNTLVNMEDILGYFEHSDLNEVSSGMMFTILKGLERNCASAFFNSLGADMTKGQTISQYVDELEVEMFDRCGLEMPTEQEVQDYIDETQPHFESEEEAEEYYASIKERGSQMSEEELAEYGNDNGVPTQYGEGFDDDAESDDVEPNYKEMQNVLPPEGKIDQITSLPFHNYITKNQTPQTPTEQN